MVGELALWMILGGVGLLILMTRKLSQVRSATDIRRLCPKIDDAIKRKRDRVSR
jgi:hypothetical protein